MEGREGENVLAPRNAHSDPPLSQPLPPSAAFFSEFQGAVTGQHEVGADDVADDGVTFCVSAAVRSC